MKIRKIGVLGAGLMGSGIAQVAAVNGFEVRVVEVNDQVLKKGLAGIEKSLSRFVDKGSMAQADMDAALQRIKGSTTLEDLADSDFIV